MSRLDRASSAAVILALRAEVVDLTAYTDMLKAALVASGFEPMAMPGAWAAKLRPQVRALVGALFNAYPKAMTSADLLDCMPGRDHAIDRQMGLVAVAVCSVRKAFGADAIITDRGQGFALGPSLHAIISVPPAAKAA